MVRVINHQKLYTTRGGLVCLVLLAHRHGTGQKDNKGLARRYGEPAEQ